MAQQIGTLMVVDNTAATPVFTQPLKHDAHIVMHSATKSLNGHSDVLAGALVSSGASSAVWQAILRKHHGTGALPGTFDALLLALGYAMACKTILDQRLMCK